MSEEEQAMYALYKQLQSEASKASRQRAKEEEGIQTPPAAAPQSPRSSGGSLRYLQRPVSELVNDAIGRPCSRLMLPMTSVAPGVTGSAYV